ncbi:MAG: hypothetical protein FWB74_05935 [Defluviitaleaceae bacterium]|nr:hypothetical protein [Defluviitaleaceae bacterium]
MLYYVCENPSLIFQGIVAVVTLARFVVDMLDKSKRRSQDKDKRRSK